MTHITENSCFGPVWMVLKGIFTMRNSDTNTLLITTMYGRKRTVWMNPSEQRRPFSLPFRLEWTYTDRYRHWNE